MKEEEEFTCECGRERDGRRGEGRQRERHRDQKKLDACILDNDKKVLGHIISCLYIRNRGTGRTKKGEGSVPKSVTDLAKPTRFAGAKTEETTSLFQLFDGKTFRHK